MAVCAPHRRTVLAGLLASMVAGCGEPAAPAGAVLHRGNSSEPASLDPHRVQAVNDMHIVTDLFMGLMGLSADARPVPGAAERMTVSGAGRIYTFQLREGHQWSDGVPVTADDFVFSFRRLMDPATAAAYASFLYVIENARAVNAGDLPVSALGVVATGPRTLVLRLEAPAPYLPELLTLPPTFPVPAHVVRAQGDDWVRTRPLVSNGPFRLARWRPNDFVRLDRNSRFYDAYNVALDTVIYYPTDDQNAALRRFRAGELDMNNAVPVQHMAWLREEMPDALRITPRLQTAYVTFNTRRAPFDDGRVRRALSMAVDRDVLAEEIMAGVNLPAHAFVPPGIANYPHTERLAWHDISPVERRLRARDLLAEAGFDAQAPLRFEYRFWGGTDNRRRAIAVAAMWKDVGVEADLVETEIKTHLAALRAADFAVAEAGWVADFNDPVNFLSLFDSAMGQLNYSGFADPAYDALLVEAAGLLDLEARGAVLARAERRLLQASPIAPLLYGTTRHLVAPHVTGFTPNAIGRHPSQFLALARS